MLRDSVRGDPHEPLLAALHGVRGAPDAIDGFTSSLSSFSPRTFRTMGTMQMLPPSLTKGVKNDSLYAVKVFDDRGS